MFSFLPRWLLLPFSALYACLNAAFWSLIIIFVSVFKLLPIPPLQRFCTKINNLFMRGWLEGNSLFLPLVNKIEWQIEDEAELSPEGWYLVLSNHLSWTDIVVLGHLFKRRIPVPKFFMKHGLIYIPLLGLACWGVDMPFMRRYSKEYLRKHPEARGKDMEATRRSCERFRFVPTTVINFVEGTRCTEAKIARSQSRYQHLLNPKAGGVALTLEAMGEQFTSIVDVTLSYPDNRERPFLDLLSGRMQRIRVSIKTRPVTPELIGDYMNDEAFRVEFQNQINTIWAEKDALLTRWHQEDLGQRGQ